MPLRNVIAIPHPLLSRVADEIGSASQELAGDLVDTMYGSPACVGLAAPQIEVGLRAFVVDVSKHRAMAGKISNGLIKFALPRRKSVQLGHDLLDAYLTRLDPFVHLCNYSGSTL